MVTSRYTPLELDAKDPLAGFRNAFLIPDDLLVYLDGNSLGRSPIAAVTRIQDVIESGWAGDLTRSWDHWLDLPRRAGTHMCDIIGS